MLKTRQEINIDCDILPTVSTYSYLYKSICIVNTYYILSRVGNGTFQSKKND